MPVVKHPFYVYLFPLSAVLIWAINMVVTRYAVDFISPISISFYRWLIAWLLLSPFFIFAVYRQRTLLKPYIAKLFVLSAFGMVCYQGLAYSAAHYTTATNMGIINAFIPIFSIFLSLWILNVRPNRQVWIGVILSILGLSYLMGRGDFSQLLVIDHLIGDLLMLIAVGLYAFYGVYLQKWKLPLPLGLMLYVQISFAVLLHLPLVAYWGLDTLNTSNLAPVLYAALLPSIVAPFVWMIAIQKIGANRSSIFINLAPIFTAIIAYWVLGEAWTQYHTIGGLLVLVGILLTQRKPI